jgi:hypothetical protein
METGAQEMTHHHGLVSKFIFCLWLPTYLGTCVSPIYNLSPFLI